MEMGKTLLYLRSLSLKTWLGIVVVLIIIGIVVLWFFTRPPTPAGIAVQNQEVGKQTQIIAEKDKTIAATKGQVQGLQTAYSILADKKLQVKHEIDNDKPPQNDSELVARAAAIGLHIYCKGSK